MRSGRPAKSVEKHKADGTYRKDRHGSRAESRFQYAPPVKPKGCPRPDVWDLVVSVVPDEVQSPVDALVLLELCRLHALMDELYEAGDHDQYNRIVGRAAGLWTRFGCDPRSRPGIKSIGKPQTEDDPLHALLKLRKEA